MASAEEFDPYRKWLGIPPSEQPPHHYRLLGIAPFESDPDVIQNACDRQMAHVRTFQTGRHAAESQLLLNELAVARRCLTEPARKATYDAELRQKLAPPKPAPPRAPVVTAASPVAQRTRWADDPERPAENLDANDVIAPLATIAATPPPLVREPKAAIVVSPRKSRPAVAKRTPIALIVAAAAMGFMMVCALLFAFFATRPETLTLPKAVAVEGKQNTVAETRKVEPVKSNVVVPPVRPEIPKPPVAPPLPLVVTPNEGEPIVKPRPSVPVVNELPAGPERVAAELATARRNLAERAYDEVHKYLVEAEFAAAQNEALLKQVAHLTTLRGYVNAFWSDLRQGVFAFQPGEAFTVENTRVQFVRVEGELITYKLDDREFSERFENLRGTSAVALAWHALPQKAPQRLVNMAAFLLMDRHDSGDEASRKEVARRMWNLAAEQGLRDPVVGHELGIMASATSPVAVAPTTTPTPPVPVKPPATTVADPRMPLPDDKALAAARRQFSEQFGPTLARARTSEAQLEAVRVLITWANDASLAPALKYVVWERVRDISVELANPEAAVEAVAEMARDFQIDALREKSTQLFRCASVSPTLETGRAIITVAQPLFDEALAAQRYDQASRYGDLLQRMAARVKDGDLMRTMSGRLRSVDKLEQEMRQRNEEKKIIEK